MAVVRFVRDPGTAIRVILGGLLLVLTGAGARAPLAAQHPGTTDDTVAVRAVAQAYLDGLITGDTARLARAFAPEAQLFGVPGQALQVIPVRDWIRSRAGKQLDPARFAQRVDAVDVSGDAASVRTDLMWPDMHYVDYLSLLRIGGQWRIVNKIWHEEPNPRLLASLSTRPLGTGEADRYVGRYTTGMREFEILAQGDELAVRVGTSVYRLRYQGDQVFAPDFDLRSRLTFITEDGQVTGVNIQQGTRETTARRAASP